MLKKCVVLANNHKFIYFGCFSGLVDCLSWFLLNKFHKIIEMQVPVSPEVQPMPKICSLSSQWDSQHMDPSLGVHHLLQHSPLGLVGPSIKCHLARFCSHPDHHHLLPVLHDHVRHLPHLHLALPGGLWVLSFDGPGWHWSFYHSFLHIRLVRQ